MPTLAQPTITITCSGRSSLEREIAGFSEFGKATLAGGMALKDGGRLFVVVGSSPNMEARLVRRTGENDWQTTGLFETDLPALVNAGLPPQFSF